MMNTSVIADILYFAAQVTRGLSHPTDRSAQGASPRLAQAARSHPGSAGPEAGDRPGSRRGDRSQARTGERRPARPPHVGARRHPCLARSLGSHRRACSAGWGRRCAPAGSADADGASRETRAGASRKEEHGLVHSRIGSGRQGTNPYGTSEGKEIDRRQGARKHATHPHSSQEGLLVSSVLGVWMNGELVGHWAVERGTSILTYAASWLQSDKVRSLSLSLPITGAREIRGQGVENWFDNLLPDNDRIRQRLSRRFRTKDAETFTLLEAIGRDCAGAVQLLPEGMAPGRLESRRVRAPDPRPGPKAPRRRAVGYGARHRRRRRRPVPDLAGRRAGEDGAGQGRRSMVPAPWRHADHAHLEAATGPGRRITPRRPVRLGRERMALRPDPSRAGAAGRQHRDGRVRGPKSPDRRAL